MAQDHSVFSNIQDNRTSSLAEQVADQINQVIIDQNINAGEKLPNEFELAARLNVGRGTIREAVKLLVARNCLEIRRGKGTFVVEKPGQIEDPLGFAYVKDKITLAVDLMELRLQLEPWVAQLAAQRIEENEKDTLRQLCEQVEHKIRSVAFCCISTGVFGFPQEEAAPLAVRTVRAWLDAHPDAGLRVVFDVFGERDEGLYRTLLS